MAKSLLGRSLRWAVVLIVGVWVVYLAAANLILNTGILDSVINKKPEKSLVEWSGGWTVLPGFIHVEGLRVRGQSKTQQWQFRLGEADVRMSILALPSRTIRARRVRGANFHFRQRPRLTEETAASAEGKHYPEIEGLSNPPDPAPEDIYPPKKKKEGKRGWHIDIADVVLTESVELWVGELRIAGGGMVDGQFEYQIPTEMHLPRARFDLHQGEIALAGVTFVNQLDISLDAQLGPFTPKETKGLEIFDHLLGSFALENGTIPDVEVVNNVMPPSSLLKFEDGSASFNWFFEKTSNEAGSSGNIEISGQQATMLMGGRQVAGDFDIATQLVSGSLARGQWEIAETSLVLDQVDIRLLKSAAGDLDSSPTEDDLWWLRFHMKTGNVDLGDPNRLTADFDFEIKNTEPIMHVVFAKETEEGGAKLPRWVKRVPDIQDLRGSGQINLDGDSSDMENIVIVGDKLGLTAWAKSRGDVTNARMFFRLKGVSLGLEIVDGKRDIKILHPRRWASEQPGLDQSVVGYEGR